jgi:hypothetical protein
MFKDSNTEVKQAVLPGPDKPLLPILPKITAILAPLTATSPITSIDFLAISSVQLQFCTLIFPIQHENVT